MALLPLDFVPVEMRGMSFVTAILLAGFATTVYYVIRWLDGRITEAEKMTSKHNTDLASIQQSSTAIAKSLDITRENMRDDLKNAVDRIEDRFTQVQSMITDLALNRYKK